MGCDIHDWAEVRKGRKWVKVGKVFPNPYHDPERPNKVGDDGYEWNAALTDNPFGVRCYSTFAVLANVRNGRGFAGCDTGDGFVPISMPRGLPEDVSDEVLAEYACQILPAGHRLQKKSGYCTLKDALGWIKAGHSRWLEKGVSVSGPDWHSDSWLTLRELGEYDWDQTTKRRGYVYPDQFKVFLEKGHPEEWCGDTSSRKVSNAEMKRLVAGGLTGDFFSRGKDLPATQVEWKVSYRQDCKYLVETTLPNLRKLGGPDDVRLVFWFDN